MVNTTAETDEITEKNNEYRARVNIMSSKRVRLLQDINTNEAELKALKANIQVLHSDMSRLNDLIGKNTKLHDELKNSNFVVEKEFIQELKELEGEAVQMEGKISEIKAAKNKKLGTLQKMGPAARAALPMLPLRGPTRPERGSVWRIAPPLTVTTEEIDTATAILDQALGESLDALARA